MFETVEHVRLNRHCMRCDKSTFMKTNMYRLSVFSLVVAIAVFSFSAMIACAAEEGAKGDASVIAAWNFDGENPAQDISGNGHTLTLLGKDSHFVEEGKSGGALLIEEKVQAGDARQGVDTKNAADLNPKDAFSIEMWISPDVSLWKKSSAFLLDKKYYNYSSDKPSANTGYLLLLRPQEKGGCVIEAQLGFGESTAVIRSDPQHFEAGHWYLLTFAYDGKGGATFYVNKSPAGKAQLKNRNAITPSKYKLVIGDRYGSLGHRFLGKIDEVRMLNTAVHYFSGKVLLNAVDSRTAFYRMENNASARIKVTNDSEFSYKDISLHVSTEGISSDIALPELPSGKSTFVDVPLNTRLRPGAYEVTIAPKTDTKNNAGDAIQIPVHIVSRDLPNQLPIIMWGVANRSYNIKSYTELASIGYTGQLMYGAADNSYIWENGAGGAMPDDKVPTIRRRLDQMMQVGVDGFLSVSPGRWASSAHPEFNKSDRLGKKINDTDGLYPEIQKLASNTGASLAHSYGDMPGWKGTLIHTEVRDHTAPSFNEIDKKAYRDFSGHDIPSQVTSARGISYHSLPDFPASRIIPDDDPILQYYKWFWKGGDGWPKLNSLVNDGLKNAKSAGQESRFTWFDPSVRAPSIYGSSGDVDFLNQWTYSYPNPLNVGLAADEQFAMAAGQPGQKVMNMIQIIWKRQQVTKPPVKGHEAEWEKISPKAQYITIAPDHLSEGTWLELARPVQAIANHGWASLGDRLGYTEKSYVTTNTAARPRMTALYQNVVKPLGPMLQQVPDYPTDVAFLESFTSQMFALRGTYGWGRGWGADSYAIAQYAGLQPKVIYDETIEQKGLGQYKVLFLMDCDVLSQSVAGQIRQFQQGGGIVIGDDSLAPGIMPDILLKSIIRGNDSKPHLVKAALLTEAKQLRNELDAFYAFPVSSSNPDVIMRLRQFGDSQYLFTVNDQRTYGDYVGQYQMVMEKGLPSTAQITLPRSAVFVYDLMKHQQVAITRKDGKVLFPVELAAGEGNVFLIMDKPVGKLQVQASPSVRRGGEAHIKVLLCDSAEKPLDAVAPLKVTITDVQGRIAEKSGYYGAAHGALNIELNIAPNDAPGKWQVQVQEMITGQQQTVMFEVAR